MICLAGSITGASLLCAADVLNTPEDGGPGVYGGGKVAKPFIPQANAKEFPIGQTARIVTIGGGVRGFGLLAEFPEGGPRRILVSRQTTISAQEPYIPAALARVFDPAGNLVAVEDFSTQGSGMETRALQVPEGAAGIWRISFSGGRQGDLVELRLPPTDAWGVRGEMALGVSPTTPRPGYLWVPPSSRKLFLGVEAGVPAGIALESRDGKLLGQAETLGSGQRKGSILLDPAPANQVVKVVLPQTFEGAIDFEGAPGLLCPTPEAAERLQGGTVDSHGVRVAGPLQARARDWMIAAAPTLDRDPHLNWPAEVPADLASPSVEVLPFGKYGGLNGVISLMRAQNENLDPAKPYFGIPAPTGLPTDGTETESWMNFLPFPGRFLSLYDSASFAALHAFPGKLNPAFHDSQILKRAIMAAFFHLTALQGDDLIRDGRMITLPYPLTHTFFIYDGLAQAYLSIKDALPADAGEIWRQGLMAIADKAADHQAYESNQWAHVLKAHLETYLATGEKRFLSYFERGMRAYLGGAYGPNSKFGQHPAGYFLEEYGPDGNYDRLNLYSLVACYNHYKGMPGRDETLTQAMKQGIEKNLRFKSFFWLPQPDGSLHSPTALNCRTSAMFCLSGYPGEFIARGDFPLGASRYYLDKEPAEGIGAAGITSFVANTPDWIARTIRQGVAWGGAEFEGGGQWLPALAQAYGSGVIAEPEALPFTQKDKTWQLPGLLAWNRGGIYGLTFYDVVGAQRKLVGHFGGGPTVLWTPATGAFLSSMQPVPNAEAGHLPASAKEIAKPEQLTYSCVFGKSDKGVFFASGSDRSNLRESPDGRQYSIVSRAGAPMLAAFTWEYAFVENGLDLSVAAKTLTAPQECFVNLPILTSLATAKVTLENPHRLVFATDRGSVAIEWPEAAAGRIEDSISPSVKRLVVPITPGGESMTFRIRVSIPVDPS
ncbi:hypothetical protein TSACC_2240 [Terrimicrobium sacchariphilum]|uniref:Uncharacterized protein n=1 Tax=Terrimicrobium sacchariphilum TaxID=690879 RepID=A0A146G4Z0_TERSA|nr:hypothetical protein [Terrimicrobium sacchariphilum]GAT31846.1 hypothetical protein TSACC_2240 [Terrimicrobium sacchariphilum]